MRDEGRSGDSNKPKSCPMCEFPPLLSVCLSSRDIWDCRARLDRGRSRLSSLNPQTQVSSAPRMLHTHKHTHTALHLTGGWLMFWQASQEESPSLASFCSKVFSLTLNLSSSFNGRRGETEAAWNSLQHCYQLTVLLSNHFSPLMTNSVHLMQNTRCWLGLIRLSWLYHRYLDRLLLPFPFI